MAGAFELKFVLPSGVDSISKLPPLIQSNVIRALQDGIRIAEKISTEKYLTGPRPDKLAVKTGLLRSRVKGMLMGTGGDPSVFASAVLGVSGVKYARIHEEGGTIRHPGSEARNAGAMVFFWKGRWRKFLRGTRTKAHPINIKARPYLSVAMDEARPVIERLIQSAINKAYEDS